MVSTGVQSPLNQAHNLARVAEKLEKSEKLNEAFECHGKVIEFLELSAKIASFPCTQESIQLQIKYHIQRKKIIQKKQEYLKLEKIQKKMEATQNALHLKEDTLQWAIYKKIDEADLLIDTLNKRSVALRNDSTELGTSPTYTTGIKHPKDDHTVIEELHMLNSKLRDLVSQLLNELEESQKEAAALKKKLKYYESTYVKKDDVLEDQNLIDFSSISSSAESIGIIS